MSSTAQHGEVPTITMRKVHLWRKEIDARPTALAAALQPLVDAGIRLRVFMRYRHFRDEQRAVIEVCPHESEDTDRCSAVMRAAGLKISHIPTLLIEWEDTLAVEYDLVKMIAAQDLNLVFCVSQAGHGKRYMLIGFVSEIDAEKASLALLQLHTARPSRESQP